MAGNNTTFHAKITADARQFIEQVESASQSLQGLIGAYGQAGKQASKGAAAASGGAQDAKKEVKDVFSVAKKEQEALHQAALQNEQELASFRKRERQIAESAFRDQNKLLDLQEQAQIRGNVAPGPIREGNEGIRDIKVLQESQRRGNAQIAKEQRVYIAEEKRQQRELGAVKRQLAQEERSLQTEIARQNRKALDAMVTGRYALYDMANAYRGVYDVAQQVTRELLTMVSTAAQFESSFTAVERALSLDAGSQAFIDTRESLIELSREIPVTFDQLSQIAALGGQMGVANQDIEQFTETVAAFTATTGIAAEETANKFGRIASLLNVPVNEFENLGSAIIFAGFNAVATESEILSMTQSISASASKAGLAADETVGLATALASLGLAPELSRGALQRIFGEFDRAIAGTSGYLDDFARVMGTTEDQIAFLWREDPSQFFTNLLQSLSGAEDFTAALDELGIVNIRDVELITRLSQNMDVYTKSLEDASQSYSEGTALADLYSKSADNLESSFIRLSNSFAALQDALGSGLAEGLKPVIDVFIGLIDSATQFAKTPIGQAIVPITAAVTAAVAAFAGFNYITNIATAQILAMRTAQIKMAEMTGSATLGFKALYNQLVGNVYIYTSATGQIKFLTKAELEAGIATGTLNKELAEQALAAGSATAATRGLSVALKGLGIVGIVSTVLTLGSVMLDASGAVDVFSDGTDKAAEKLKELGQSGITAAGGLRSFQDAIAKDTESARISSLEKLKEAQGEVNTALEIGIGLYGDYQNATGTGTDIDLDVAEQKGAEYRKILAETLLAPGENGSASFVENFLAADSQTEGILSSIGFDYLNMVDAAFAEGADGRGAQQYVLAFQEAFRQLQGGEIVGTLGLQYAETIGQSLIAQFGPEIGEPLAQRIRDLAVRLRQEGVGIEELAGMLEGVDFSAFLTGAESIDATNAEVDRQLKAQDDLAARLAGTTGEVEDQANAYGELGDQLKEYLNLIGAVESANQNAYSAFGQLASAVAENKGGFTGLGAAAQENLGNLQTFINAAFTAGYAEGEGTVGALERISAAIFVLGQQGGDTAQAWEIARGIFVNSLTLMGGQYAVLAGQLSTAPDFKAAEIIISGFINAADAAGQLTPVLIANINALRNAMAGDSDYVSEFTNAFNDAMASIRTSSSRTVSALDKLKDALESTFKWANQQMGINNALRTLGQSLEENGKTFNIWRESGEENVGNLISVINELAERSGGNMQTFANYLASLRVALQQMGVGASGLRYIDAALEDTGKTGKATDSVVQRLTDSLMDIGSAEDEIMSVADAIDQVANAAVSGIQARFSQAFAIDEITLGWLDMQDAAADAAEEVSRFEDQMASAREQIEDARLAIDEANASIQELTADRGKLEYQLSVALRYGDTLRAEQIRADLAKIDADIAREQGNIADANRDISDAQRDIRDAEQGIIDVRTQSTRETIEANRALVDMAERYATATAHMLVNAEEGADLNKIIDDQVEAFKQNAIEMGYTEEQAQAVADVLRDELIKSMEQIPENIETEINAETSAAMAAVNSFVADANRRLSQIDRNITITTTYQTLGAPPAGGTGGGFAYLSGGGLVTGPGTSTSDSIAARLSDGEYVVRAAAVEQYGVPFLNALNQQRVTPAMMSAPASSVVANGGVMSLSPEDRALLRAALDRPVALYTDNTVIAKSANAGNQILAQRGLK